MQSCIKIDRHRLPRTPCKCFADPTLANAGLGVGREADGRNVKFEIAFRGKQAKWLQGFKVVGIKGGIFYCIDTMLRDCYYESTYSTGAYVANDGGGCSSSSLPLLCSPFLP